MDMQTTMDNRLWDYLDGICSSEEATATALLLQQSAAWQARYETLKQLKQQLQQLEQEEPSLRFTQNIMDKITALPAPLHAQSYINKWVIRLLAATFLLAVGALLAYGFAITNWQGDTHSAIGDRIGSLHFSNSNMQFLAGINILIVLLLAERISSFRSKQKQERSFKKQA